MEIPKSLANRIDSLGPHFCLVKAKTKDPSIGGKGWQKPENLMLSNDPRLQKHLQQGGNYGVVGGFGIVIVDVDTEELKAIAKDKLPKTYTVQSPGSKGWHLYYIASIENPIRLRNKKHKNVGDIQGQGKMVVGPNSIHPNGKTYKVIADRPLAQVTREQLIEAFKDFVVPDREIEATKATARMERKQTSIDLSITQVVPLAGLQKRGSWYQGSHPIHGSQGGMNFTVHPNENYWHCFRCESGGGPLLWLAVQEGIIDCVDAGSGALRGETFKKVLRVAIERGYISEEKANLKSYGAGVPLGDFYLEQRGPKVFLFAKNGDVVASRNLGSVDGPRFKKFLKDKTHMSEDKIAKATATLLLNATDKMKSTSELKEEQQEEFDEETKAKALKLLEDPAFFYKLGFLFTHGFVVSKLNKPRFIVGEERNKRLLGLLLLGSAKLGMTSIIKLLGEPATAKDTMMRMWLDILPIKSIERSYFTAAGLRYSQEMRESDLLYIPDSPELKGEMGRQMRFMRADDGGLISEYALKDKETGEMTTKIARLPVKGIATTSNAITGDRALESGMWTFRTNGSEELTQYVKREKLRLRAGKRKMFSEEELKVWKYAFLLLAEDTSNSLPKVGFAEELISLLESARSESRRDPDKLCDLISLIAWTRRFQKMYEEADLADLYYALQMGLDAITQTISELDEKEQRIFQAVKEGGKMTIRDVASATKIPYKTSYPYLEKLVDKGFLNKDKEGGKNVYSLLTETTPKILIVGEGSSLEDPKGLMHFILKSFRNFSTSHGGTEIILIDPLTGDEVKAKILEGKEVDVTIEKKEYSYPYEKMRSIKTSPKQTQKDKQIPKELLPHANISNLPRFRVWQCPICNRKNDEGIVFCQECGFRNVASYG